MLPSAVRAQARGATPRDSAAARSAPADSGGALRPGTSPGARGAAAGSTVASPAAAPDSGAVIPPLVAPEDTTRRGLQLERAGSVVRDTARWRPRRARFDAPRWVMLRSLLVPGWGQLHNGSWLKAALIGGLDAYFRVQAVTNERWIRRHEGPVQDALRQAETAQDSLRQYLAIPNPDTTIIHKLDYWQPIYNAASDRYQVLVGPYNERIDRQINQAWILGGVLVYSLMDAYVDAHFRDFKVEFETDPALPGGKPPGMRLFLRWIF